MYTPHTRKISKIHDQRTEAGGYIDSFPGANKLAENTRKPQLFNISLMMCRPHLAPNNQRRLALVGAASLWDAWSAGAANYTGCCAPAAPAKTAATPPISAPVHGTMVTRVERPRSRLCVCEFLLGTRVPFFENVMYVSRAWCPLTHGVL